MKNLYLIAAQAVTLSLFGAGAPEGLTTEYRTDPVGIDAARPRLT